MPRVFPNRPFVVIPMGSVDGDPGVTRLVVQLGADLVEIMLARGLDIGMDRRIDFRASDIGGGRVRECVVERAFVLHSHSSAPFFHA